MASIAATSCCLGGSVGPTGPSGRRRGPRPAAARRTRGRRARSGCAAGRAWWPATSTTYAVPSYALEVADLRAPRVAVGEVLVEHLLRAGRVGGDPHLEHGEGRARPARSAVATRPRPLAAADGRAGVGVVRGSRRCRPRPAPAAGRRAPRRPRRRAARTARRTACRRPCPRLRSLVGTGPADGGAVGDVEVDGGDRPAASAAPGGRGRSACSAGVARPRPSGRRRGARRTRCPAGRAGVRRVPATGPAGPAQLPPAALRHGGGRELGHHDVEGVAGRVVEPVGAAGAEAAVREGAGAVELGRRSGCGRGTAGAGSPAARTRRRCARRRLPGAGGRRRRTARSHSRTPVSSGLAARAVSLEAAPGPSSARGSAVRLDDREDAR